MITLPCPRCYELARALGEARLERDALRAAAVKVRAAMHECFLEGSTSETIACYSALDDLAALLPPEAP